MTIGFSAGKLLSGAAAQHNRIDKKDNISMRTGHFVALHLPGSLWDVQ